MTTTETGKAGVKRPKREMSPLRRACLSLGLPVDARPRTNLARLLRRVGLEKTATDYLQLAKGEQARKIVELYHRLNSTERRAVTIDYLILAAGADAHQIAGLISEGVSRFSGELAVVLACMSMPEVTKKTIRCAKKPGGHKDRELIYRIAGYLPTPVAQNLITIR